MIMELQPQMRHLPGVERARTLQTDGKFGVGGQVRGERRVDRDDADRSIGVMTANRAVRSIGLESA